MTIGSHFFDVDMDHLHHAFARNRAEESSSGRLDNWESYIVPLFFSDLEVSIQKKPIVFIGGRGCGKTSLLRYLSHRTQLSPSRRQLPSNVFEVIGLYYRADTQFLRTFVGSGVEDEAWMKIFEHGLCLSICAELLDCVRLTLNRVDLKGAPDSLPSAADIRFVGLEDFSPDLPADLIGLTKNIKSRMNRLATWTNNVTDVKPLLLPLKAFTLHLIESIRSQIPVLEKTRFNVFIDEYENMLDYQKRLINTLLKHSEEPLVFNIAIKRNALEMRETVGSESLQEVDDLRSIDLEERLAKDFDLFCGELFLFRLSQPDIDIGSPVTPDELRDPQKVEYRKTDSDYRHRVLSLAKKLLPGKTPAEVAGVVLGDPVLRTRLLKLINAAIEKSGVRVTAEDFIDDSFPEASVVNAALVHQSTKNPKTVQEKFDDLRAGRDAGYYANRIHTYLQGTLYLIYLPLPRICPLYGGFESFIQLASRNIRHFLELSHRSWLQNAGAIPEGDISAFFIPLEGQLAAVREASMLYFEEIKGAGELGNRLFAMTRTLGQIFRASQERPSQSEAERTHFSIKEGQITDASLRLLREAVKWSVLFETAETKVKNFRLEASEYQLNPIYAPFFGISFRKGRKLEISAEQFDALSSDKASDLIKKLRREWSVDGGEATLF